MSETNIKIDTSGLVGPLNTAVGAMAGMTASINDIKTLLQHILEHTQETRDCVVHMHDSHLHAIDHTCEDRFDVESGSAVLKPTSTAADLILREFQNNIDYDGNGLIYGRDFMISRTDSDCPPQVRQLDALMSRYPNSITWSAYLETLPDNAL